MTRFELSRSNLWQHIRDAAVVLGCAVALTGCGGGGGVDVGGTGTEQPGYAEGSISGFGSVVVNGVHYDDSAATVRDEDGRTLDTADLALGMTVRIEASDVDSAALTGVADVITVAGELRGRIDAIDTAGGTLTVFGQTVRTTASTVYSESLAGGFSALAVGDTVQVYALLDEVSGSYLARRIQQVAAPGQYLVRGAVSAVNTSARTFDIGGERFVYDSGTTPAGLAVGAVIRVQTTTSPDGQGRWPVASAMASVPLPPDGVEVELEAVVSAVPAAGRLTVAGYTVDTTGARIEPSGVTLQAGDWVEVEGRMVDGVLVAEEVKRRDEGDSGDGGDDTTFEVDGSISRVDAGANSFVVRGVNIVWDTDTEFKDGTASNLVVGAAVEVEGVLAADGVTVRATKIEFDD